MQVRVDESQHREDEAKLMVAKLRDMVNRLQTDLDDRSQATAKASAEQANLQVSRSRRET